jgi:endonuclease/exonuclease/phosphatase (EEP) superfamily protein YafD
MDLCVPWRWLKTIPPSILTLRVLTCNVHEDALDAGAMAGLIEHTHPDVVALQECDSYVAREVFRQTRWNLVADRELWLASRYPIRLVGILPENGPEANHSVADRCQIMTPAGVVTFYNLHLISPHGVFSDTLHLRPGAAAPLKGNINLRLREATELAGDVRSAGGPVVLAGDFNLPSDSAAYSQTFAAFTDAFSQVGFGFGWTYRVRWTTTRIDHILSTGGIVPRRCWVAGDVGSPHRPLIADLEWVKN